ncbi:MAG: SBBP repeat-containing protein [Acidobacteriota bacterium]
MRIPLRLTVSRLLIFFFFSLILLFVVKTDHHLNSGPSAVSNPKPPADGSLDEPQRQAEVAVKDTAGSLDTARIKNAYNSSPLSFEVNKGQTDSQVKFLSRGSGYGLFLTPTEAVIALNNSPLVERVSETGKGQSPRAHSLASERSSTAGLFREDVLRMRLLNASALAQPEGINELPGKTNYFVGNDPNSWRTDLARYGGVEYKNVYDGIDLIYYGNQRQLEYDFVVAPDKNPEIIRIAYEGSKAIRLDEAGNLVLQLANGQLKQGRPFIYQMENNERKEVSGRYVISGDAQIGFDIDEYDQSRPLIIDPVFLFSTYFGGGAEDVGADITVDAAGNAYITGRTVSTNFPTVNPFRSQNGGLIDAFVTKLNSAGSAVVYSTYIGGNGDDEGFGIAVNSGGEVYLTGYTRSANFPLLNALQPFPGGGSSDAFLLKLNPSGNALINSTYAGGNGQDVGTGIALDGNGNLYGIGYTTSTDLQTFNALQSFNAGGYDGYVLKVSEAANALIFSTYSGGSGDDFGTAIAVDSSGFVSTIGETNSTNLTTVNALQSFNAGGFDAFISKLTPSGTNRVFATYAGGSGDDSGTSIAIDGSGNIYAVGFTNSTNFSPIVNALQATKATGYDAFITKLSSNGATVLYSTFFGGNNTDAGYDISADSAGNAYITGETLSADFPLMNPVQGGTFGSRDAFVSKLNPNGSALLFSTNLGGGAEDNGYAIAITETGNAYVTGRTTSTNFPTTSPLQPSLNGAMDSFISKITTVTQIAGPRILFGSKRNGENHDIHVMDSDGSNQIRLTNNAAYDDQPKWSSNTSKIAFMSNRDGNFEIYSMNADGTNQTRLTNSPAADGFPAWSPDGTKIAFVSGDLVNPTTFELFVMNSDGSNRTRLTNDSLVDGVPTWSPDGSKIVFMSGASVFTPNSFEIFVINPDGSNRTRLTTNTVADGQPSYSPDGTKILFASGDFMNPNSIEIFSMNANGTNRIQLTSNSQTDAFPDWSPDGSKIVFASGNISDETTVELFVMNADGSSRTRLTNNSALDWFPEWLPSSSGGGVQFASSGFTVNEGGGSAQITVNRTDSSAAATVDYATTDTAALTECNVVNGVGSSRCDYATSIGTLRFAAGEGSKTIFIPIVDDSYAEGNETFTINLTNVSGANLGSPTSATVTINDNETVNGVNPIDGIDFFIRQQYIDFLGREPDPAGLAGWRNVLNNCGTTVPPPCDRIEVSAGFFRSEEFQSRGYFIYRFYSSIGRIPLYAEFMPDFAKVSGFLTNDQLEANKVAFVREFMERVEFQAKYASTFNNPTAYVDALLQTVGLPSHPSRAGWIATLNSNNNAQTRAVVLRQLVESSEVYNKYYNEAFVIMQYFGYLRRTADASYLGWIQTMNQTGGDYRIMINGFLNSAEYRRRFGP